MVDIPRKRQKVEVKKVLTGEFRNTVDEKGRVMIPAKLKAELGVNSVYATRGIEPCIWLMKPQQFEDLCTHIVEGPSAMFDSNLRVLQRRIIAPAQEMEFDKSGRINLPPTLRKDAGIELKAECVILGISDHLEIWSVEEYEKYLEDSEEEFAAAAQNLSRELKGLLN